MPDNARLSGDLHPARIPSYGPPLTQASRLDRLGRWKNRLMVAGETPLRGLARSLSAWPDAERRFIAAARQVTGPFLYSLKLEVNRRCTLRCKMCYADPSPDALSLEFLTRLFRSLRHSGVRLELLGGEPLLRTDIVELVRLGKNLARAPYITLYTNAVFASRGIAQALRQAGLDAAIVTLISHQPDVHDAFTGVQGSWQATVEGIRQLKAAHIPVYTFTAIHRDNYLQINDIFEFSTQRLQAHALFYQYIPQAKDDPLSIPLETWAALQHRILFELSPDHMDFVRQFCLMTGNACSGGNFVLTVKADGSLQPCPFVSDVPLGNLHQADLWTLYRRRYQETRLTEFKVLPEACQDCTYASVCGGGCRAGGGVLYDSYAFRDHKCPGPYHEAFDRDRILDRVPTWF